jgi:hypothetical protein
VTGPAAPPAELVAYSGRGRLLLLLGGSLVLVAASLVSFGFRPGGAVLGVLGVVVFGVAAAYLLRRLLVRRPVLVLDVGGLVDRASAAAAGRVPWDQVADVGVQTMGGNRVLSVLLRDPETWLAAQPPLRRRTMAVNARMLGTPVNIPLSAVDVPEEELLAALDRWRQHAAG